MRTTFQVISTAQEITCTIAQICGKIFRQYVPRIFAILIEGSPVGSHNTARQEENYNAGIQS